ncbi:gluconeogenesis factor YvcK family protein [Fonticella tunisiensis]|uniref:Putative gluconeogenesis factor n=1 Tax=Fonticella tunisiensis TaxID=1096341 RepID=A0A4R7KXI5_9CLOT|nr:YvcK family protein [Fonticella tunisiensis]TDT63730.1 putative cofD-like protein [Fonticella tunisiensis]
MNFFDWLKPGIKIKRWIMMGMLGLSVLILGMSKLLYRAIPDRYSLLYAYLGILGLIMIYSSLRLFMKSILGLIAGTNMTGQINRQRIGNLLYEQRLLVRGPRIVAIGGGTGLSTMLRGLKEYTTNITAIVTVADDGGGSGVLRKNLGMLPPGDIRNCLVAMAHTEPLMEELMQYRFKSDGDLSGQSFGNLFIAAMTGISSNFEEAIKKMSDVLAVKGRVYPVTLDDVKLYAKLSDGSVVKGESFIPEEAIKRGAKIEKVYLEPLNPKPLEDALFEIDNADCIIMGPGSLYTSVLPNLVIKEVAERVKKSKAPKVYVSNIMTQPGETDGYKLSDHIKALEKHCGELIDYVIANNGTIPEPYFEKYRADGQNMVEIDKENVRGGISIIEEDLVYINDKGLLRHNTQKLANTIMKLILKKVFPTNRRRILDYYYLSERVKDKQREVK